jgi:large subunit ribosomal protein L23
MSIKDLFSHNQSKQSKTAKVVSAHTNSELVKETLQKQKINVADAKIFTHKYRQVLVKPLITEKGAKQTEHGKYLFMVSPRANKIMVKQAILEMYGIRPAQVNILNYFGKKINFGRRQGVRKDWKKAVVTLPTGKTIDIYKGV